MEFYSHLEPEKIILKDHLQYVGDRCEKIIQTKNFAEINKDILSDVSYLIGVTHDFGKYTTFFQEKLKASRDKNNPLTYHGLISALFTFEVVSDYVRAKNLEVQRPYKFLPLLAYFVVKRHHLDLDAIKDDVDTEKLFNAGFKDVNRQLEDIWKNKGQILEELNTLLKNQVDSPEKIFNDFERYKKEIKYSKDIEPLIKEMDKSLYFFKKDDNRDITYYLLVQLIYSVLIDSDKKHAGHIREIERKELPESLVEDYLKKEEFKEENKSNINHIRNEIRESVLKNIIELQDIHQERIFTLTAPTGTGKTLTSLSAALILRKRLRKELKMDYEPRIIYSLPFTSIIDQNYNVFNGVLSQIESFKKNESEYLLKHHYLSEVFYKTEGIEREEDIDESLALIESWESEIVVTTFIQLFYTLVGYKNRTLKKFHNIANSIIILDEVQNIPIEYWKLIAEILIGITKYFNCRVILMTATKPLIFEEGTYKELVDDYESYYNRAELNRVCLNINTDRMQIVEFCNSLDDWSKNSYLFVLNTINSSFAFYKAIIGRIQELGLAFKICYLSTNIIPKERKRRIEKIREAIKSKQKIIIVSTQLIEAGVDIDCDCVYRDMGPLDSIMQVSGRCNRNKRLEHSDVHLLNLVGENNKPFTGIYDSVLLEIVRQILKTKNKSQIPESEFLELISEFFKVAKDKSRVETKMIDSIYELYFYDKTPDDAKRRPISEFKLIKEEHYKADVFVELDAEAEEVWKKYQEIITNKELKGFEKRKEFLRIKKSFYDYVMSVDKKKAEKVMIEPYLGYIGKEDIQRYYDTETGYISNTDDGAWII